MNVLSCFRLIRAIEDKFHKTGAAGTRCRDFVGTAHNFNA